MGVFTVVVDQEVYEADTNGCARSDYRCERQESSSDVYRVSQRYFGNDRPGKDCRPGASSRGRKFRFRDGDVRVSERPADAWLPACPRHRHPLGCLQGEQAAEEHEENHQEPFLDGDLPGREGLQHSRTEQRKGASFRSL